MRFGVWIASDCFPCRATITLSETLRERATRIANLATLWTGDDRWYIGSNTGGALGYFDGIIDEVRIYNRALSATEIKQLYNAGR
jgi:hypothetical protein